MYWLKRNGRAVGAEVLLLIWFSALPAFAVGQENMSELSKPGPGRWNWPLKTLGGQQYWTDVRFREGWRIQHQALTDHFRLLDPRNVRRAWGSLEECLRELDQRVPPQPVSEQGRHVVVVLHGLMRTHNSMRKLAAHLETALPATVINFEYASSQAPVEVHARHLGELLANLPPGVERVDVVAHSLGNIVVRHLLADWERTGQARQWPAKWGRMVMLGPPNQGSQMAKWLQNNLAFQLAAGPCGQQLGRQWDELRVHLATPEFPFAIIAGGRDDSWVENWFLSAPNDFIVDISETALPGARDSRVSRLIHSTMMNDPEVLEQVTTFLRSGYLVSEASRRPITAEGRHGR